MTRGASGARNRGVALATQSYVAFLDSDDLFLPGHLRRMAGVLERNHEFGFVVSRVIQMSLTEVEGHRMFAPWNAGASDSTRRVVPECFRSVTREYRRLSV